LSQPLAIDLYCGLGGWAEGFLSEGYRVIGFEACTYKTSNQMTLSTAEAAIRKAKGETA
jgi:site-specific DNA-cytosine methylase